MSDHDFMHLGRTFKWRLWDLSGAHVFIAPEVNDCLLAVIVACMFSFLCLDKVRHKNPEPSGLVNWPLALRINAIIRVCTFDPLKAWPAVIWKEETICRLLIAVYKSYRKNLRAFPRGEVKWRWISGPDSCLFSFFCSVVFYHWSKVKLRGRL